MTKYSFFMIKIFFSGLILILATISLKSQSNKDKIVFDEYKAGYYENYILKDNAKDDIKLVKPEKKYRYSSF